MIFPSAGFVFQIVVALLVIGFLVWLGQKLPVAEPYKSIATGVVVFAVVLWILYVVYSAFFGGAPVGHGLRV
jgi:energy-coupling factor transporter transmembrane protein EcfT